MSNSLILEVTPETCEKMAVRTSSRRTLSVRTVWINVCLCVWRHVEFVFSLWSQWVAGLSPPRPPCARRPVLTASLGLHWRPRRPTAASATPPWGATGLRPTPLPMPTEPTRQVSAHLLLLLPLPSHPPSPAINKKLKQMLVTEECFAFR